MSGKLPPPPPHTLPEEERELKPRKRKVRPSSPVPPLWSFLLTIVIVIALAGCWVAVVIALGSGNLPRDRAEPVLTIIASVPSTTPVLSERFATLTPTLSLGSTGQPAQSVELIGPTLVPTATATSTAITIAVGTNVIVISPGGANIRSAPGTNSPVEESAGFNETYQVIGGPEPADDLIWWQIRNPRTNQTGWIAENDGEADLIEVFIP